MEQLRPCVNDIGCVCVCVHMRGSVLVSGSVCVCVCFSTIGLLLCVLSCGLGDVGCEVVCVLICIHAWLSAAVVCA